MKIVMVLTSHDVLGNTGHKTGFWLEEFAAPYFVFRDAGVQLTLVSPKGGQPPLDPKSDLPENQTPAMSWFKQDLPAQQALSQTVKLAYVKSEDYDRSSKSYERTGRGESRLSIYFDLTPESARPRYLRVGQPLKRNIIYVGQENSDRNWSIGGIGAGLVEGFLREGYNIVAMSREANRKLTMSGSLVLLDGDIGKQQTAGRAVEAAINNFGTLDVLVNNAGISLTKHRRVM